MKYQLVGDIQHGHLRAIIHRVPGAGGGYFYNFHVYRSFVRHDGQEAHSTWFRANETRTLVSLVEETELRIKQLQAQDDEQAQRPKGRKIVRYPMR